MNGEVVDLFSGPGGWDLGARALGLDPLGVEHDADACATRAAAGLRTLHGDVSALDPAETAAAGAWGLIASPPCTAFSTAGKGRGRPLLQELVAAVEAGDWTARPDPDPAIWLILEVGRWAEALQPEWIACWEAYARRLERQGYHVWAGKVSAEQYGVAQTRCRALLLAHRSRPVGPPPPTHQKYEARQPDRGRHGLLLPWVSMADALGWSGRAGFARRNDRADGAEYRERDLRPAELPAFGVTEKARSWMRTGVVNTGRAWKQGGDRADAQERPVADPAPTVDGKGRWVVHGTNQDRSSQRSPEEPAPTIFGGNSAGALRVYDSEEAPTRPDPEPHRPAPAPEGQERLPGLPDHGVAAHVAEEKPWAHERPATTVAGRPLVPDPGANANRFNGATKSRNDGIRVSLRDVLVLQSFPPDYPVQGNRTSCFRQVGNAVPPLLAAHVLAALLGLPAPDAAPQAEDEAPTGLPEPARWAERRPAPTVTGDPRLPPPQHHGPRGMNGDSGTFDASEWP